MVNRERNEILQRDHADDGRGHDETGLLPVCFFDTEVTWILTNCSSVRLVKSMLVIEDWLALLVAAANILCASHKPAMATPIVIRSRNQPNLLPINVFVALPSMNRVPK